MNTLSVTARGQVTLQKDILDHLRVKPGGTVRVMKLPDGAIEIRAVRAAGKISDVFGSLKRRGQRRLSIEEIGEIAADGWGGQAAQNRSRK